MNSEPTLITPGVSLHRNNHNGYVVMLLHHSADAAVAPAVREAQKMMSPERYAREYELDFTSYAGKAVYPEFKRDIHIDHQVWFNPAIPVWRGWDFGYHRPAVVFTQVLGDGSWWILGECLGQDQTLDRFLEEQVLPYQERLFPNAKFLDAADPAGKHVSDKTEHTSFAILAQRRIFPYARRSEIDEGLTHVHARLQSTVVGKPGIKVHPRCLVTVEGMQGGYRYPEPTTATPEPKVPLKDGYFDHIQDTIRYIAVNCFSLWQPRVKKKEEVPTKEQELWRDILNKAHKKEADELW